MCEACPKMIDHNAPGAPRHDAEAERIIDRAVQRRLASDAPYRYAENDEEQAQREDEITAQEEANYYGLAGKQRDPYHRGIQPC